MIQFNILTSTQFSFQATVDSHGWRNLAPFHYDKETRILTRIERLTNGVLVKLTISDGGKEGIQISVEGIAQLTDEQRAEIELHVSRCFSLHWNLDEFYQFLDGHSEYVWIAQENAGRMLIGATVWEDLAKTLFTTNTTWAQTIAMTQRLCSLGDQYAEDEHAFPTPEQIAAIPFDDFAEQVRAGYRAAYLHALAEQIASGELDVEAWYGDISSDDLYKAVKSLKGFGDYAAGTMLRLLGHFDQLAIDTACRSAYKRVTGSDTAEDKAIKEYYQQFGEWQGLMAWMDVMRD